MKATLKSTSSASKQFILVLAPENEDDRKLLKEFGALTRGSHMINCRGFQYLASEVEFLIQPMPRGD